MLARIRPEKMAGALSLLAAALIGAIWYIYLFVAPMDSQSLSGSAIQTLTYTFSPQHEDRWWFASLAGICVASGAAGIAYLSGVARTRVGAVSLLLVSAALSVGAFVLTDWALALFVALPVISGYRCVHGT